ncbi:hypothetical protein L1S32_05300 [Methanogenium sp. S4BF]|uniref:hypothetical protein n=1 Tax=Methanogenium sp. S4BF TaxID=1789226 RepID=UPI002415E0B5|nr:hypothetical protein [Methanogenium sp. S4BF]WFN35521.1 hypothetical protein L1S32_05300 [Methanogenium sp. S4BF]
MNGQKLTQIGAIFAVIAVLIFLGLAIEGKAGIALFNNSTNEEISSDPGEPISYIISNLTRPAEVEITAEDIQRIPKVEGTVLSNGNGNSSEYEEAVLNSFLEAAEHFSGAGAGMETYKIETFDLLTDPDFAEPSFLGREKGVKASIVYNSSPGVLENTYWGHLTDASVIAYEIYGSTTGKDTGYVTISYMTDGKQSPRFQVSLTAKEAEAFSRDWTEDTYLPLSAWSAVTIDKSADIAPYENIDTALPASRGINSLSSDAAASGGVTDEYKLYISKDDLKDLLGRYSTEMQNQIQLISTYSADSDFRGMADASKDMINRAAEIEDEITQIPIPPQYTDVADNFLEGMRNYQYAGTYFWYGATFTETEPVKTGNNYVQQGFANNNDALAALDMETIETDVFDLPNGRIFPDAKYMYENYEYQDSSKRNDISAKLSSFSCTNMYTLIQDGNKERNVAGYGYKYIFPVVEFHHLGYRGSGSSRITTPATKDFAIIYNGEEYSDLTPSPYVGRTLDETTYIDPIGYPYYSVKLDRKGEFEGVLIFLVPQDFDPAKAYLKLDLGSEVAVWHMVPY